MKSPIEKKYFLNVWHRDIWNGSVAKSTGYFGGEPIFSSQDLYARSQAFKTLVSWDLITSSELCSHQSLTHSESTHMQAKHGILTHIT